MEQKKIQTLLTNLQSKNIELVSDTIKEIRHSGNIQFIKPLAQVLLTFDNTGIHKSIFEVFIDIKEQQAAKEIIEILNDNSYHHFLKEFLTTCWQSVINYSDYLSEFVDIFIHNEFSIAFEAFTVIENMELEISDKIRIQEINKLTQHISTERLKMDLTKQLVDLIEKA